VVSTLTRSRIFLVLSVVLFGVASAATAVVLSPDGLVRARSDTWGPPRSERSQPDDEPLPIVGYRAGLSGELCGIERRVRGGDPIRRELPECHAFQAPEVVRIGGRTLVVWERADSQVAVSVLGEDDLGLGPTLHLWRPRSAAGYLLPRTAVVAGDDRLAIRYSRGQVVTVGSNLSPWPGGVFEVWSARIGPRGLVLGLGIFGLLSLYFAFAGWTLTLPLRLRREKRDGRCLEIEVPERGSSVVIDGRAFEIDLDRAWFYGLAREAIAGSYVTLVLGRAERSSEGAAYRDRDRLRPWQVWAGGFDEAMRLAKGMRTRALALAIATSSVLVLALDAYLVW
jgi:hypothetical protein